MESKTWKRLVSHESKSDDIILPIIGVLLIASAPRLQTWILGCPPRWCWMNQPRDQKNLKLPVLVAMAFSWSFQVLKPHNIKNIRGVPYNWVTSLTHYNSTGMSIRITEAKDIPIQDPHTGLVVVEMTSSQAGHVAAETWWWIQVTLPLQ